jgi:hypothetical protein
VNIELSRSCAVFTVDGRRAGRYVLDDPFKPHLAELLTPAGHNLTVVSPADHRHHKGVMFALRCGDLNFWEEEPGSGACGVQEVLSTELSADGLMQELLWREHGGGLETYRETRTLSCRPAPGGGGFEWTWHSHRTALRAHRLVMSPWSVARPDGTRVNYHGLGVRLPWSWGYPHPGVAGLRTPGGDAAAEDMMGTTVPEVTMWGKMDGHWEGAAGALTLRQEMGFPWFVLRCPFPYLAAGPTNLAGIDVATGRVFDESYCMTASDLPRP